MELFSTSENQCYYNHDHYKTSLKAHGGPTAGCLALYIRKGRQRSLRREWRGTVSSALLFTISVIEGWLSWVSGTRVCLRHVGREASWGASPEEEQMNAWKCKCPLGRDLALNFPHRTQPKCLLFFKMAFIYFLRWPWAGLLGVRLLHCSLVPPVKYKHALEQAAGYLPKHLRYLLGVVLTSSPYHWHWIKLELHGTHRDI